MAKIFLVRHGETKLQSSERLWGHTDVELSDAGVWQAERARDRLAAEKIDVIYSSHLKRAVKTAEIIASRHNLKVIPCPEIGEINFGEVEGFTFKEVGARYPELAKPWPNNSLTARFPGGESFDDLNRRVSKFLERLDKHTPEETALVVAHNGPLRLIICGLLRLEPLRWRQFRLDLGAISTMETYPGGAMLTSLNDTAHLQC